MDFSSVAASAAIAASAASLPVPVAQPALPTEAQAPGYVVGEQWTFQFVNDLEPAKNSTFSQIVTRVDLGGRVELNGGAAVLDANGNNVKTASGTFEPSDGKLQFPLAVGKTWKSSSVYRSGSWASEVERQAKVVGVEQVQTPAGAFASFKIEMTASWSGTEGNRGEGTARETDWYAPAVGRVIKMDYFDRPAHGAPLPTHVELLKFSKPQ